MKATNLIFNSKKEDFFKIFFFTFLAFALSFYPKFLASPFVILVTVFLLDGGHVYSTMIEVYADPEEIRRGYVWIITFFSFALNLIILYFFNESFFYYIFYFTVFHNMRQGLGITFLYRKGEKDGMQFYKLSYYFLTVVPFILFHLRPRLSLDRLSDAIIKSFDATKYFPTEILANYYHWGIFVYVTLALVIAGIIFYKRNFKGSASLLFFFFVYYFAFVISKNEFQSYLVLITSHAIPYFFLMQKRVTKTHSVMVVKRYAPLILISFFVAGGAAEYFQNIIVEYFDDIDILMRALLTTPLIAHFIFDGVIWKRGNDRFKQFLLE